MEENTDSGSILLCCRSEQILKFMHCQSLVCSSMHPFCGFLRDIDKENPVPSVTRRGWVGGGVRVRVRVSHFFGFQFFIIRQLSKRFL